MIETLEELKNFFKEIEKESIIFKKHFYDKKESEREYLSEKLIIDNIKNINKIIGFQKQLVKNETLYRIGIKLSNKYTLVVVFKIEDKDLYIITAWKTYRKWQKAIQN
ncbi:hypothetical protein J4466_00965 [Candidatus Pacearchaeota archaeon]|nr:hypothetical protein [Candidatus Pacearchaeota archaeon]